MAKIKINGKSVDYNKLKAASFRVIRVLACESPAIIAAITEYAKVVTLPQWVVPTLVLLGTVAVGLDKYVRDAKAGL